MSLATFAYVIGIIELLVGIPLIVAPDKTMAWMKRTLDQDALLRSMGAVFLIMGFFVLKDNYSIGKDVAGLIRLVAWITVVKSFMLVWFPNYVRTMHERWSAVPAMRFLWGFLAVLVGVLFMYAGNMLG